MKKIQKLVKDIVAEILYFWIILIHRFPKVATISETIDTIVLEHCSIARFGDGEMQILANRSIIFQKADSELAKRLEEVLLSNDKKILIGLPDVLSYKDINKSVRKRKLFYEKEIILRYKSYKKIPNNKKYYNTHISRPYLEYKNKENVGDIFKKIEKIWENREVLIVEGEGTRLGIGNDLFENVKSISRILCPAKDAFDKYSEILKRCTEFDKDKLFILALGPTATVLAYDLAKIGYQAIDIGHLDIEYEWFKMGVNEKVKIKGKYVNEVKSGRVIEKIDDKEYEKQIVYKIL